MGLFGSSDPVESAFNKWEKQYKKWLKARLLVQSRQSVASQREHRRHLNTQQYFLEEFHKAEDRYRAVCSNADINMDEDSTERQQRKPGNKIKIAGMLEELNSAY